MIKIKLGDKVKDKVTGFEGIAIGLTTWLHGCRRVTIQPQELKDGKPIEAISFDEPQIEIVKKKKVKEGNHRTGGPRQEAIRRTDATR